MKAFKATVMGKVQGVWFRDSTLQEARKLNVMGWVKNMPDGTVYLEAEGDENKLKVLEQWLHVGSPNSHVENVDVEWIEPKSTFAQFEMRF